MHMRWRHRSAHSWPPESSTPARRPCPCWRACPPIRWPRSRRPAQAALSGSLARLAWACWRRWLRRGLRRLVCLAFPDAPAVRTDRSTRAGMPGHIGGATSQAEAHLADLVVIGPENHRSNSGEHWLGHCDRRNKTRQYPYLLGDFGQTSSLPYITNPPAYPKQPIGFGYMWTAVSSPRPSSKPAAPGSRLLRSPDKHDWYLALTHKRLSHAAH